MNILLLVALCQQALASVQLRDLARTVGELTSRAKNVSMGRVKTAKVSNSTCRKCFCDQRLWLKRFSPTVGRPHVSNTWARNTAKSALRSRAPRRHGTLARLNMHLQVDQQLLKPSPAERQLVRLSQQAELLQLSIVTEVDQATHQMTHVAGRPLLTHLTERDQIVSQALAKWKHWELLESMLLLSVLRPGMTVVDAGANVGYYTSLFAAAVGSRGGVHAFEPEPENFLILRANALLSAPANSQSAPIWLHNEALGKECGAASLAVYPNNLGYHSLLVREEWMTQSTQVPVMTLDARRFGDGHTPPQITTKVDLIKADIQGAELDLVIGGHRTLATDRPLLCLEFEPEVTGRERACELVASLEELGYDEFRVFHAAENRPSLMLRELSTWVTAAEIRSRVEARSIRSYGTLWASHSAVTPPRPCDSAAFP